MSYLYGDSTPAPIDTNYIELLRNALEFSVDVLLAADRMHTWQAGISERQRAAAAHTASLRSLGQSLERVLDVPAPGGDDSPTGRCAATLAISARTTVSSEIRLVESTLATERERLSEKIATERTNCKLALEKLLLIQQIPGTTHQLHLRLGDGPRYAANARARLPIDVTATMTVDIPAQHMFSEPVRVDKLVGALELCAPEMRGWLHKKLKLVAHKLDKKYVAELMHGDRETRIALRTSPSMDDSGFNLRIAAATGDAVIIPVQTGEDDLPPYQLDEEQTTKAHALRDALVEATKDLHGHRTTLVSATIDDHQLQSHDDPSILVRRLVAFMAPVVQEIAKHSPMADELVLKLPIGDDRRQELFVAKAELWRMVEPLPSELRSLFEPLGLAPHVLSMLDSDWSEDDGEITPLPATD